MNREWVYQRVQADAAITADVDDRVFPATRIREDESTRSLVKPLIVYRVWGLRPEFRGDDGDIAPREVFQFFVHDTPGDYLKIDRILTNLHTLFADVRDQSQGIISEWLEMSEDFRDNDMHTIMRYCRIQVKYDARQGV